MTCKFVVLAIGIGIVAGLADGSAKAALLWNGNTADWNTPAEWNLGTVPNTSGGVDDVEINSGTATYSAGPLGDFRLNTTMTVGGSGTFTQDAGVIAWMKVGDGVGNTGTVNVNAGGTFESGGATNFFLGVGGGVGNMSVNGGTVTIATNWEINDGSSLSLNGGSVTQSSAGEFRVRDADGVSVSDGSLSAFRITFDGLGATALDFSGGSISVSDPGFEGVYSIGGDDYIDFTGASGEFFLGGGTTASATALLGGRIRRFGAIDPGAFVVMEDGGGVRIALATVPEPTALPILLGLGVACVSSANRRPFRPAR